ncbi:MAG: M3 family metallopeptidase [Candidatus Amulumruptor caecigallinarius]|nr:M3 family metallopeptidase [Candidatus Amulumruptor caecigallinarius]MCM1397070.1 M3 family metallopeptidase [Candidatus Amulumruptor caecigallinarius]MCM1454056.1 M3 family metallopeptidase [bacterium]
MSTDNTTTNPLLGGPFATPHTTVPFSSITPAMMEEAVGKGIAAAHAEVDAIAAQTEAPTFANTIVALERTGRLLDRALNTFYPLLEAAGSDEMDAIAMRITPQLSEYSTSIILNEQLWERVKAVYEKRDELHLDPEDSMLLQETYDMFARNGALLRGEAREEFRALKSELGELTTRFGQNVLHELNTYEMWLTADDLDGLPESSVEAAALAAREKGRDGEYLFTLQAPVYIAFLKHSARRDLREKMWRLYAGRNIGGEFDNVELMKRIAEVRRRIAGLLGHDTYAAYSLAHTMAKTPGAVMKLLGDLTEAYRPALEREMAELRAFAAETEGRPVELKPWDYSYYANKLRQSRYSFDDEQLRPYFELSRVIEGVFSLATRLYGITFAPAEGVEVYHPDVKAYEVRDADGSYLGIFYADFFPRSNKRPGAWMTNFTEEEVGADGTEVRPHVTIVTNFTKPTESKPSLLTPGEVRTFLHEFGHSLHGLLARTRYKSLSGTSVRRDFVELPSQFNENFLTRREFLDSFARHYVTGEPIPAPLVDALIASQRFGAAYACLRQLNFGLIDMAWHTAAAPVADPVALEREAGEPVQIFPPEEGALVSPQFSHIFAGGYAAGYYSYKWSEVLDADAFARFEEEGVFNPETARSFRENILERGGTEDPALLYRRFRGKDPTVDALLHRDGIAP